MSFKPFYVSTKDLGDTDIINLWDQAVSKGAEWYFTEGSSALNYNYFGIDEDSGTYYTDVGTGFGEEAVELTYEEASLYVQSKFKLEAGKTYKLIDKEGYLQSFPQNCKHLELKFKGLYVTLDRVDKEGDGWVERAIVISSEELEYFELVEDKPEVKVFFGEKELSCAWADGYSTVTEKHEPKPEVTPHTQEVPTRSILDLSTPEGYKDGDMTFLHIAKPAERSKLRVTKVRPTSGQFVATWIYDGKPWCNTYKYDETGALCEWSNYHEDWEQKAVIWEAGIEVWYTIIN